MIYNFNLFKQFEATPEPNIQDHTCDTEMIYIDGFATCLNCGIADLNNQQFVHYTFESIPKQYFYERTVYFNKLLNLITGKCQFSNENHIKLYNRSVEHLKTLKFESVIDLIKIMKIKRYKRFYKYVYSIYHEIKNVRPIMLNSKQCNNLFMQFTKFNKWYKVKYQKRNIIPYRVILFRLMKHNNYEGYENVILPYKSERSYEILNKYFNNIK